MLLRHPARPALWQQLDGLLEGSVLGVLRAFPVASAHFEVITALLPLQVDPATGEIAGVFESIQPSDTDLGATAPKDVKITGLWYGQLS